MSNKETQKEYKCTICDNGYLQLMSAQEKLNADLDVDCAYYGCDECKYVILKEELGNILQ